MNMLYLAFAHIRFHRGRSLVMMAVAAIVFFVPFAAHTMLSSGTQTLVDRAANTPLILGRKGSRLDLTMTALTFAKERTEPLPMREIAAVEDSNLALAIPLHTAFSAHGFQIVGTTLDYFDIRGLEVADGRAMAMLGEVVLGANVAKSLDRAVGDTITSSAENLFDLDGIYPLKMAVVGVLAPTHTADDDAIFADIKTAWVIQGIGHGHDDVLTAADPAAEGNNPPERGPNRARQITSDNIESFHFHGDRGDHPVTAAIVVPNDVRAATILRGRYLDPSGPTQLVQPDVVLRDLLDRVFRTKTLLDVVVAFIGIAAFTAIGLAVFLSYRLRAPEVATAIRLGARRSLLIRLLATESLMIFTVAGAVAAVGVFAVRVKADAWMGWLLAFGV